MLLQILVCNSDKRAEIALYELRVVVILQVQLQVLSKAKLYLANVTLED